LTFVEGASVDAVPVIARGHNVAILLPPIAEALAPVLQAIARRPLLVLASTRERAWDLPAVTDTDEDQVPVSAFRSGVEPVHQGRALRLGAAEALERLRASRLHPSAFAAVVLAWPEELDEDARAAMEAVLAECARESQRVIVTAEPGAALQELIERYAFKAMTYGFPPVEEQEHRATPAPVGAAHFVIAPTALLERVRRQVLETIPAPTAQLAPSVVLCPPDRAAAQAVAREAAQVGGLLPDGLPVLVLAPYQVRWARTLFSPLTPLRLPGATEALQQRAERLRERLAEILEHQNVDAELLTIGPLLDRHDPAEVAAAALRLATLKAARGEAARPEPTGGVRAYAKIWVGFGRKDGAKPGDLVGALANEAKVPADAIGRIELRNAFCLVEVRPEHAEAAAKGLTGVVVRGRRLTARVDHGPAAGPGGRRPNRRA
jgi:ATP-dependent RNA helicase DeaD